MADKTLRVSDARERCISPSLSHLHTKRRTRYQCATRSVVLFLFMCTHRCESSVNMVSRHVLGTATCTCSHALITLPSKLSLNPGEK